MAARTNWRVRKAVRVMRPHMPPLCQYWSIFWGCCGVDFMVVDCLHCPLRF